MKMKTTMMKKKMTMMRTTLRVKIRLKLVMANFRLLTYRTTFKTLNYVRFLTSFAK